MRLSIATRRRRLAMLSALAASAITGSVLTGSLAAHADTTCSPFGAQQSTPQAIGDGVGSSLLSGIVGSVGSNLVADLLTSVITSTGPWGSLIELVTGSAPGTSLSPDELAQFSQVENQLASLQTTVDALVAQQGEDYAQLQNNLAQGTAYDAYISAASSTQPLLTAVQADVETVSTIQNQLVSAAQSSGQTTGPLTQTQQLALQCVYQDSYSDLRELNDAVVGSAGPGTGLFSMYAGLLWAEQNALSSTATVPSPSGTLLKSETLTKIQTFIGRYAQVAIQSFNAFSEAANALYPDATYPGKADNDIQDFYDALAGYINNWSAQWTFHLPALAPGIVADLTSIPQGVADGGAITLWTAGTMSSGSPSEVVPVTLAGLSQTNFCASAGNCIAPMFAADGATSLDVQIVPARSDLQSYLSAPQLGLSGWTVPSSSDVAQLITPRRNEIPGGNPTIGSPADLSQGVSVWATAEGIPLLQARPYALRGTTANLIPPFVTSDQQIITLNQSDYTAPEPHATPPGSGFAFGGQLLLENSLTVSPPFSTTTASSQTIRGAASVAAAKSTGPASGTARVGTASPQSWTTPSDPGNSTYVQPEGYNAVQVTVTGAAGGTATNADARGNPVDTPGGQGATVTATIPLQPTGQLFVGVGGVGGQGTQSAGSPGVGGVNGGGTGGTTNGFAVMVQDNYLLYGALGAGGGGSSAVCLDPGCTVPLVVAGGGGGGGASVAQTDRGVAYGGAGGNACYSSSCDGAAGSYPFPGQGGSLQAGGGRAGDAYPVLGDGEDGQGATGGTGGGGGVEDVSVGFGGGGGGGGWLGGGGGGGATRDMAATGFVSVAAGGGAGGSSFLVDGATASSFGLGGTGNGAVTITPVLAPEFYLAMVDQDPEGAYIVGGLGIAPSPVVDDTVSSLDADPNAAMQFVIDNLSSMTPWAMPSGQGGSIAGTPIIEPVSGAAIGVPIPLPSDATTGSLVASGGSYFTLTPNSTPTPVGVSPLYTLRSMATPTGPASVTPWEQGDTFAGFTVLGFVELPAELWIASPRLTDGDTAVPPSTPPPTDGATTPPTPSPAGGGGSATGTGRQRPADLATTGAEALAWWVIVAAVGVIVIGGVALTAARTRRLHMSGRRRDSST